ncbi:MAG: cupredoxin domain-containing protein [Hyphomicrobiales bacterium]|nr:cupredoxin domain-containing protein [Hyphomicrobiales bacterium]MDE2115791.1 cupredoxin domain-containing protein [Hyphomicrobiales bacterium]
MTSLLKFQRIRARWLIAALALGNAGPSAHAADPLIVHLTLKDHRFEPQEVKIPANQTFTIKIKNLDPTPEEFESQSLRVEKVIVGGSEGTLQIRPLNAGRYRFFGDYNESTAFGYLDVR